MSEVTSPRTLSLFDGRAETALKRLTVPVAISLFLLVAALYVLRPFVTVPERLMPDSFIGTLNIPFTVLLLYETVLLILALPRSVVDFLQKQFEVASLIVINGIFKELSKYGAVTDINAREYLFLGLTIAGSLILYLLIEILERVESRYGTRELAQEPPGLLSGKRFVAVLLLIAMGALAAYQGVGWVQGWSGGFGLQFFQVLYSALIGVNVLLLLMALGSVKGYSLVYEYTSFILASVLVNVSLSLNSPVRVAIIIAAIAQTIATLMLHRFVRSKRK